MADATIDRLWSLIRQLQGALGGMAFDFGTTTLTWAAAALDSNAQTVTHSLGRTPLVVGAWGSDASAAQLFYCYPYSYTSTQFSLKGAAHTAPGASTYSAVWIAIG